MYFKKFQKKIFVNYRDPPPLICFDGLIKKIPEKILAIIIIALYLY